MPIRDPEIERKVRSLRSKLIEEILSHPGVPDRHKNDIPKLNSIVDSLETMAGMLGNANTIARSHAEIIVAQAMQQLAKSVNGEQEYADLLIKFLRERSELAAFDADPHVFICHSSNDRDFANRLALGLVKQGYRVWFDDWEILVGDSLYEKVQSGVKSSAWFLIILREKHWADCRGDNYENGLQKIAKRLGTPVE